MKSFRQFFNSYFAFQLPHFTNSIPVQFRHSVALPFMAPISSLIVSVLCIFKIVTFEEMGWPNTSSDIAFMQHLLSMPEIGFVNYPRKTMCSDTFPIDSYTAITLTSSIFWTSVKPACFCLFNTTPKKLDVEIGNFLPYQWKRYIFCSHIGFSRPVLFSDIRATSDFYQAQRKESI